MGGPETGRSTGEPLAAGTASSETMVCPSCERLLPVGSLYCPHCCGHDGRRGAIGRGAMFGWVFGFLAGGLASAAWSSFVGPEQAGWTEVLTTTFSCAIVGMVVGMVVSRKG
jgi:hypothetical protein